MRARISFVTRKARGGISHRDEDLDTDVIRFGRSASSEVYLADPRVPLEVSELHTRPGGTVIHATGTLDLRHNGAITRTAQLKIGDTVSIGPYDAVVIEPAEGFDVSLTVELTQPLGDDLTELKGRSTTHIGATGLSKRSWSWALFAVVAVLFLVIPIVGYVSPGLYEAALDWPVTTDEAWESGQLSAAHRSFGEDCSACHENAFVQVRDSECLECHAEIANHVDPVEFQLPELAETRYTALDLRHADAQRRKGNRDGHAPCFARLVDRPLVDGHGLGGGQAVDPKCVLAEPVASETALGIGAGVARRERRVEPGAAPAVECDVAGAARLHLAVAESKAARRDESRLRRAGKKDEQDAERQRRSPAHDAAAAAADAAHGLATGDRPRARAVGPRAVLARAAAGFRTRARPAIASLEGLALEGGSASTAPVRADLARLIVKAAAANPVLTRPLVLAVAKAEFLEAYPHGTSPRPA